MNGRFIDGERGELARLLFESTRDDAPPAGAQARALSALGIATGVPASSAVASAGAPKAATAVTAAAIVKWIAMGAGVAFLTLGALAIVGQRFFGHQAPTTGVVVQEAPSPSPPAVEPRVPVRREPSAESAPRAPHEGPSGAVIPFESLPRAEPAKESAARAEPATHRRAESRRHSTLAQEVESLDRVRLALGSSDPASALRELDVFASRFQTPSLGPESTVLRVQALLQAGNRSAAERLARRFVAASPGSPHAARVRLLLEGAGRSKAGATD